MVQSLLEFFMPISGNTSNILQLSIPLPGRPNKCFPRFLGEETTPFFNNCQPNFAVKLQKKIRS